MKLLVFEWLMGGGCLFDGTDFAPDSALHQQGWQMLNAVCHDLAAVDVVVPIDARFPAEIRRSERVTWMPVGSASLLRQCLLEQALACDAILLIAPECGGCLNQCCQWLEPFREKFISPDSEFVSLTSDKQKTAEWLSQRDVGVPPGCRLSDFDFGNPPNGFDLPWVIKPINGAGSEQIQFVTNEADCRLPSNPEGFRIEQFVQGHPVSVSVLCGGLEPEILPPTGQVFDAAPIGHYVGAEFPLATSRALRATALARATISALPPTRGYIGIDMILSSDSHHRDCVVDVNPRLTMSYLKLREICGFNLAEAMLRLMKVNIQGEVNNAQPTRRPNP